MSSQLVYISSGQSGYDMALPAGQEVTVTHDGSTVTAKARSETVAELLERLHITPSPLEMVAVYLDEDRAELTRLAKENGLIVTGGTDYHGINTVTPRPVGAFTTSDEMIARIGDIAKARKSTYKRQK